MKKAILFDADGVLLDTWDFIVKAMEYTLSVYNIPRPSEELVTQAMGQTIFNFYKVLVPNQDFNPFVVTHRAYQQNNFHLCKPFPKVKQVLKELKWIFRRGN